MSKLTRWIVATVLLMGTAYIVFSMVIPIKCWVTPGCAW